ncbi:protein of unknown function [Peptoclostridium litorale DSM 5388]|uniref:DUF4301 domain-containing protein n=1 Tax=Peptoclostridium litorale DSM 5388 TaxID=1121324 RepID=A0A069REN0_PEPLI|nr:DUF4301 family protein [Peptoclostridium litorale]KDR94635.1 hypothetical protein CLIT_14c00960 [Peptoclostridium litorale DSM 5388]SIO30515.1 protein of unknown function [Peptoclostridium litorale DSM 5388]
MDKFIEKFKKGTQYVNIVSAVTANELTNVNGVSDEYLSKKCVKFIPASGAATRMFKDLYEYLHDNTQMDSIERFFDNIEQLAFYEDIKEFVDTGGMDKNQMDWRTEIIDIILNGKLNYGNLPKALIKMHSYGDFSTTPIDEHIYEGERYLNRDCVNLHFTISKDHEELFSRYVDKALQDKGHVNITYSFQKKQTDTLAVDMDNSPFLLEDGDALYRAGGHGALIENLNDLDADIVFIKNIDNVCHRSCVEDTIYSKRRLASVGLEVKKQIDRRILGILSGDYDLNEINVFMKEILNIVCKDELTKDRALSLLNRPLRVCGMVENQGDPGGGPFVVDNEDYYDLQICEKSEIDLNDEVSAGILGSSQFFNPVDLVCFVKDYRGEKFNLPDYSNGERYFISEKTYKGRKLKALEHPGLWNGAMHNWNTLFVEVPLSTFNPVKTVNDLLGDGHRRT